MLDLLRVGRVQDFPRKSSCRVWQLRIINSASHVFCAARGQTRPHLWSRSPRVQLISLRVCAADTFQDFAFLRIRSCGRPFPVARFLFFPRPGSCQVYSVGAGRSSKRFVGKSFPLALAHFSKTRFCFRETVAGHFGRAVKRSMRNVGAPESVARAGVVEWKFDR